MIFNTCGFTIFELPPYMFFTGIGFVIAISIYMLLLLKNKEDISRYIPMYLFTIPFLILGAKLFGILLNLSEVVYYKLPLNKDVFLKSGIVYYGGLLGMLLSFYFICKFKDGYLKRSVWDALAVAIPIFHCFGRIGCFFAGCCYGIEHISPISVIYSNYVDGMITTATRLPIQLIEASTNFLLFLCLLTLYIKGKCRGKLLRIYLACYAPLRIIHEILRADWNREVFSVLSFSQITSILILLTLLIIFIKERKQKS